jgi:hypothetical protein
MLCHFTSYTNRSKKRADKRIHTINTINTVNTPEQYAGLGHAGVLTVPLPFLRGKLTGSHNSRPILSFYPLDLLLPSNYCVFRGNHSSDADPGP